jgi:hypothetical protein
MRFPLPPPPSPPQRCPAHLLHSASSVPPPQHQCHCSQPLLTPTPPRPAPLQVLALVHHTSAMYSDSYSAQVATTALSAVVPAWLAAGRDPAQLFSSVTSSLGQVPPHRRLPLLSTMVSAMHEATALPIALLLLLQQLAKQQPASKGAQQEAGEEQPWAEDLAGALCAQVSQRQHITAALAAATGLVM